ncbi:MAG: hypothetical protein WD981_05445 [Gaiellaceae bacterium]
MRSYVPAILCAFIGMGLMAAGASARESREIRVPIAEAASTFVSIFGTPVPQGSCLASPAQESCPSVNEVVFETGPPEPASHDGGDFVPLPESLPPSKRSLQGRATTVRPATHGIAPGYACATIGRDPYRVSYSSSQGIDYAMRGKGENSCRFGVGVTYMEVWTELWRDAPNDGQGWVVVATSGVASTSCCDVAIEAEKNCNHPGEWPYRTRAHAYSVRNGIGYVGSDDSSVVYRSCPDNY